MSKKNYRVAVITSSDSCFAGERLDLSGEKIVEICSANQLEIVKKAILPDEEEELSAVMKEICDQQQADLILTTGGTGFTPRDCMPEAAQAIIEKQVPGIAEAIRAYSLGFTKHAMLSRGVSGIRKATLIINLPGSVKAVEESLTYIIDQLPHALGLLADAAAESKKHE